MVVVIICIKTSKLATVVLPGLLPAAVETHRLGSGRFVRAGAAHGAAAPLLAPRTFKLPGHPSSSPTPTHTHTNAHRHGLSRSVSRHCALSPSKYLPGRADAASKEGVFFLLQDTDPLSQMGFYASPG